MPNTPDARARSLARINACRVALSDALGSVIGALAGGTAGLTYGSDT